MTYDGHDLVERHFVNLIKIKEISTTSMGPKGRFVKIGNFPMSLNL